MRSDLAFANMQEFLPPRPRDLWALDIGSGTGATALRLARLGFRVTLLDSSPQKLHLASSAAWEAGMGANIAVREGEASHAAKLFQGEFFDLILCHNLLEFVEEPGVVLRAASQLMRDASFLSVLVRTQAGEILKAAIQAGDLTGAEDALSAEWGRESLFGGRVRHFQPESLKTMLRQSSLTAGALRGVRVISDYLPPTISREAEYQRILALERRLGTRPELAAAARYAQLLVRRGTSERESLA